MPLLAGGSWRPVGDAASLRQAINKLDGNDFADETGQRDCLIVRSTTLRIRTIVL
jgi:hypothetical protein